MKHAKIGDTVVLKNGLRLKLIETECSRFNTVDAFDGQLVTSAYHMENLNDFSIGSFVFGYGVDKHEIISIERKPGMNFGEAFESVKLGLGMRLPQWNKDVVIRAQYPCEFSQMTAPYLYVESRFGRVPWKETMIELFAENWEVVD